MSLIYNKIKGNFFTRKVSKYYKNVTELGVRIKKRIDSNEPIRLILRILKECILREGVLGVRRAKNRSLLERK